MELAPLLKETTQGNNEKTAIFKTGTLTGHWNCGIFILHFTPSRLMRNVSVVEGVQYKVLCYCSLMKKECD